MIRVLLVLWLSSNDVQVCPLLLELMLAADGAALALKPAAMQPHRFRHVFRLTLLFHPQEFLLDLVKAVLLLELGSQPVLETAAGAELAMDDLERVGDRVVLLREGAEAGQDWVVDGFSQQHPVEGVLVLVRLGVVLAGLGMRLLWCRVHRNVQQRI